MLKQVVAQIKLDLARYSDQDGPRQILKNSLGAGDCQQHQSVGRQCVPIGSLRKIIDRPVDDLGEQDPNPIGQHQTHRTDPIAALILPEVRKQGTKAFEQHVLLVDEILPAADAGRSAKSLWTLASSCS